MALTAVPSVILILMRDPIAGKIEKGNKQESGEVIMRGGPDYISTSGRINHKAVLCVPNACIFFYF